MGPTSSEVLGRTPGMEDHPDNKWLHVPDQNRLDFLACSQHTTCPTCKMQIFYHKRGVFFNFYFEVLQNLHIETVNSCSKLKVQVLA